MDARKLLGFVILTTVFVCASCAPVGPGTGGTAQNPDETPAPKDDVPPVKPATPNVVGSGLKQRIELAVKNVRERDLRTTTGFWTVFHGILGLGPSITLLDEMTGKRVNAVDYVRRGGAMRGLEFLPTRYGLDVKTTGPTGSGQGHQDQFVAEMGQWDMPLDQTFYVYGKEYTFADFVNHSKMRASVTENQELSWAILVIGQYVGTDAKWTNAKGEKLRFEDLLRYELDASMDQAACGGTHRLFDLAWVYHLHMQRGGKTEGIWREIVENTKKHRDLAKKYQNSDGTFSTDFFRGRGNAADKALRINTTGHTLEWMSLAFTDEELREPWVQEGANALSMLILDMAGQPIEGGSVYHAVHGLLIYYARVFDRETLGPPDLYFPLPNERVQVLPPPVEARDETPKKK